MPAAPKAVAPAPTLRPRPVTVPGSPIPAQVELNSDEQNRRVVTIVTSDGQRLTMDARQFMRIAEQVVRSLCQQTPN